MENNGFLEDEVYCAIGVSNINGFIQHAPQYDSNGVLKCMSVVNFDEVTLKHFSSKFTITISTKELLELLRNYSSK